VRELVADVLKDWEQHLMHGAIMAGEINDEGLPNLRRYPVGFEKLHDVNAGRKLTHFTGESPV
jgi:hypothetical protein